MLPGMGLRAPIQGEESRAMALANQGGAAMYVHQIDFFRGTSQIFANNIMKIAKESLFDAGAFIFQEGDPARHLYIMLEGSVRLSIGQAGQVVFIVNRSGEAFGWSSLMGREYYSASAETLARTSLMAFERDEILWVIDKDPHNGLIMYKSLAMTLANRLLQSYRVIAEDLYTTVSPSQGSRQLQSTDETA
jgi:CRP-like cAMP-binding protein